MMLNLTVELAKKSIIILSLDPKSRSLNLHLTLTILKDKKGKDLKESNSKHIDSSRKSLISVNISSLNLILTIQNAKEVHFQSLIPKKIFLLMMSQRRDHPIN